jgi:hypothetical protein
MRLWHKTSNLFMHIIFFSSVIIFLLDFIGGTKALWYCDILTHICSWFTYFFFVRFHIINLASLSNILFFLLTLFRKERKKNKGKHFLSTQFSSFFICISYRFTCSTYSPHVYIIDFWSAFYEVLSLRFFFRLFLFLNFSFHYRLFF